MCFVIFRNLMSYCVFWISQLYWIWFVSFRLAASLQYNQDKLLRPCGSVIVKKNGSHHIWPSYSDNMTKNMVSCPHLSASLTSEQLVLQFGITYIYNIWPSACANCMALILTECNLTLCTLIIASKQPLLLILLLNCFFFIKLSSFF